MKNVFTTKGKLTLSIGEGCLSAYEVSVLKTGDIVQTTKMAGEGYSVFFNCHFLFSGEPVIIDKTLGLRVTTFSPPAVDTASPSNVDDVIEMLTFMVRLGEIEVSLSELQGVGPGTIISLDSPFSEEEDAELLVAGIPAAKGKVGVTYENMHLRITQVYDQKTDVSSLEVRSSGNLLEREYHTAYSKDYNFKRPDKFSKDAIDKMKRTHDLFVRNLRLKYRMFENYELIGDQMSFGEFESEIGLENLHCMFVQNEPWARSYGGEGGRAGIGTSPAPLKYFVEPQVPEHPVTQGSKDFIKKIVSGTGMTYLNSVFIYLTKTDPVNRLLQKERQDFLVSALRGAWKSITDMNFRLTESTDEVAQMKVIPGDEMILLLTVREKTADEPQLYIVYPYMTLHPYIGILN